MAKTERVQQNPSPEYGQDVRRKDVNSPGYQRERFKLGWKHATEGWEYNTVRPGRLTWENMGNRLGAIFGSTSEKLMDEMYDWCTRQRASAHEDVPDL